MFFKNVLFNKIKFIIKGKDVTAKHFLNYYFNVKKHKEYGKIFTESEMKAHMHYLRHLVTSFYY